MVEKPKYRTYWIVDGVKVASYQTMKRRVLKGTTAIEVSATRQQIADQNHKARAKANAIIDEEIRKAAAQRAHEQSPEGQQEAARRTAIENPGGIVSGGMSPLAELDAFGPAKTNLLR